MPDATLLITQIAALAVAAAAELALVLRHDAAREHRRNSRRLGSREGARAPQRRRRGRLAPFVGGPTAASIVGRPVAASDAVVGVITVIAGVSRRRARPA